MQQHEEGMRFFALFEHRAVLRKSRRARLAQDFAKLVGAKSRKQRQMGNQRRVDCGHVSPTGSGSSIESRQRLWPRDQAASLRWRNIGLPVAA